MTTPNEIILSQARQRGQADKLPYAGAVTPSEAYGLLQNSSSVTLVDVRTNAERDWIGKVALPAEQHLAVEWNHYPGGQPNAAFAAQLAQAINNKDTVLLFLCRSGVRSRHSAKLATELGFTQCYDILGGFEGNKDDQGHRKTVDGWCKEGLPWIGA